MTLAGLPQNFSSALANNPAVIKHCTALLNDNPGPGVYPSPRACGRGDGHRRTSLCGRQPAPAPRVRDHGAGPAGRPESAGHCGNHAPLHQRHARRRRMVEQLLNDSVPMDAAFLERIADHADALNSAAHSFKAITARTTSPPCSATPSPCCWPGAGSHRTCSPIS